MDQSFKFHQRDCHPRTALDCSAGTEGRVIRFGSYNTITLGNDGQLVVPSTADGLFMDASDLPDGLTIDADQRSRVMLIEENATAALHGLTLTGGRTNDGDGGDGGSGGGIFAESNSTLTLTACTVSGNQTGDGSILATSGGSGGSGGGIFVDLNSTLTLTASTVSGNQTGDGGIGFGNGGFGGFGGGIFAENTSTLTLTACTVSGNQTGDGGNSDGRFAGSGGFGGGISAQGSNTLTLTACTVSSNRTGQGGVHTGNSGNSGSQGLSGGVSVSDSTDVTIGQSIIAGNTGSSDDFGGGNIGTDLGDNLIGGDPKLAPLGDYGGPTQTMIPLPGSQAIDAATTSTRSTDQRGFPITDGTPDIGAVEFQGADDLAPLFNIDHDGDGTTFGTEFALGTNPFVSDPGNPANPTLSFDSTGTPIIDFGVNPDAIGLVTWILERSTDLETWNSSTPFFQSDNPTASLPITDDSTDPTGPRTFYRFTAELR